MIGFLLCHFLGHRFPFTILEPVCKVAYCARCGEIQWPPALSGKYVVIRCGQSKIE